MKYLLDTNICIHYLNGQFGLDKKIATIGSGNCFISEITVLELLYGITNSDSLRKEQNRQKVEGFINVFQHRILPIRPIFETFSSEKVRLRRLGTLISDFDLLIGCTALHNNFTLATRNTKEMDRIEGLKIENWIE